jgi:hypothetical protein
MALRKENAGFYPEKLTVKGIYGEGVRGNAVGGWVENEGF